MKQHKKNVPSTSGNWNWSKTDLAWGLLSTVQTGASQNEQLYTARPHKEVEQRYVGAAVKIQVVLTKKKTYYSTKGWRSYISLNHGEHAVPHFKRCPSLHHKGTLWVLRKIISNLHLRCNTCFPKHPTHLPKHTEVHNWRTSWLYKLISLNMQLWF